MYVSLHNHTDNSLLDGLSRPKDLVERAKELGMPGVAITDHGNLQGIIDFYQCCTEAGIKPIIGTEAYITGNRFKKGEDEFGERYYHIIIIAKNNTGLENLTKISTEAFLTGKYYKPRVDFDLLQEHKEGLIITSACVAGEIPMAILRHNQIRTEYTENYLHDLIKKYKDTFGDDFYFELMDHGLNEEKIVNKKLIELSKEYNIKIIATNDTHYVRESDKYDHDVLLCMQTRKSLKDEKRVRYEGDYFLKSYEQMLESFDKEYLTNTLEICDKCNVTMDLDREINLKFPHIQKIGDIDEYLRNTTEGKLRQLGKPQEYFDRLNHELEVISSKGFSEYFYIVADYVNWAKNNGVLVGPGRGSAAGSLLSYLLGITTIDPIEYNLKFSRFLNVGRKSYPDIDIDFEDVGREKVIKYIVDKYGEDHVIRVNTVGVMKEKGALKGVAKALDIPFGVSNQICKYIDEQNDTGVENMKKIYSKLFETYEKLVGIKRQIGLHAAGFAISAFNLRKTLPLMEQKEQICTQFDMDTLKKVGILKLDLLGLSTLTIIKQTLELLETQGITVDLEKQDVNDPAIYDMMKNGETMGIFQFESYGMTQMIKKIGISNFNELIVAVSLYRPGPLHNGMVDKYISNKQNKKWMQKPLNAKIMNDSEGIILYQEHIMELVQEMAGLSETQADDFRKAITEADEAIVNKYKKQFVQGSVANGYGEKIARSAFEKIKNFAKYSFNKSHATSYATISFYTAYLKKYYYKEFMTSYMNAELRGNKINKARLIVTDMMKHKVPFNLINVNDSKPLTTIIDGKIQPGLLFVDFVGQNAAELIARMAPYTDFEDFEKKLKKHRQVNKRNKESLKKKKAFDF